jgi:hypothetical protein
MLNRNNGTDGRVYGGACDLVHIPDETRHEFGRVVADFVSFYQRQIAEHPDPWNTPLCPGCYMVAIVNLAVALAEDNGQPLSELGHSLGRAFDRIANAGEVPADLYEHIEVVL